MDKNNMLRDLVVGVDTLIPTLSGGLVTAVNFDNAATTPPFKSVLRAINQFAPWYSSIHRGKGYKSRLSSDLYENSRKIIADFVQADLEEKAVIYVKNSTEAINKLAYRLCQDDEDSVILSTEMEHHSNDLPWRNLYQVDYVSVDEKGQLSLEDLEAKLIQYQGKVKLLTVSGASNVTGYVNPVHRIAALAHAYQTPIMVDGAQLIPHLPFSMKPSSVEEHIDFLVFSGHKMYAPFGTGVLIGPIDVFANGSPDYSGGGTVKVVTHDQIIWEDSPHRDEAGTPNIMGVIALTEAIKTLTEIGMETIADYERQLTCYAVEKLQQVPYLKIFADWQSPAERVSIIPFNLAGITHERLAVLLSNQAGIAVRNGCFCAQPYIQKLLGLTEDEINSHLNHPEGEHPGVVRASFGLYNTAAEVDILAVALKKIAEQDRPGEILNSRQKVNMERRYRSFFRNQSPIN